MDFAAKNFEKTEKKFEEIHLRTIELTKKYLKKNDIVLDYGCAGGGKTLPLAGLVKKMEGIDISSRMIETAKKNAAEHKIKNADFTQRDIFDKVYKKESFDVIFAFNILHLFVEPGKALQRIRYLLKPEGLFISATPCLAEKKSMLINLQFLPFHLLSKLKLIPNIALFKLSDVDDLIKNSNFKIIKNETMYQKLTNIFIVAKKV